jgi:cholesterol oxidase
LRRLSLPLTEIEPHYTVVVVGSGYGGGVAASRLARAGQRVCVLERGREWLPGEFPNTEIEAVKEVQLNVFGKRTGRDDGLYEFHIDEDINVFKGCGLGGTSLVNANVSLEADPRVFERDCWPAELSGDPGGLLSSGYAHARAMLEPVTYPETLPRLRKQEAHRRSAEHVGLPFVRVPINVSFEDGPNAVGVEQKACTLCGDCVTGCNHGAKNNVAMNYLPDAQNHGARIFTGTSVRWVERAGKQWRVHYQTDDASDGSVVADIVVLSAGTLGTTEILLRSKDRGLNLSPKLGELFTGNGDFLAFGYNNDVPINGVGFGAHPVKGREPVGPCITSAIDGRSQTPLEESMIIEEGSLPGAIGRLLPVMLKLAAKVGKRDTDAGLLDFARESWRQLVTWVFGPYHGALRHTQTYLVMTHDDGKGKLLLDGDRLRIRWPGVSDLPIFQKVNDALHRCTEANGGTQVPTPTWSNHVVKTLVTVHPLGGCAMGRDARFGVTNHRGQVYADTTGTAVHDGLFVADGSVIPTPVGVNPLLTITALAERSIRLLARERQWKIDDTLPSEPVS